MSPSASPWPAPCACEVARGGASRASFLRPAGPGRDPDHWGRGCGCRRPCFSWLTALSRLNLNLAVALGTRAVCPSTRHSLLPAWGRLWHFAHTRKRLASVRPSFRGTRSGPRSSVAEHSPGKGGVECSNPLRGHQFPLENPQAQPHHRRWCEPKRRSRAVQPQSPCFIRRLRGPCVELAMNGSKKLTLINHDAPQRSPLAR